MPTIIPINPIHSGSKHFLSASVHADEYHNHTGAVDNYILSFKSGTGDCIVQNSGAHFMELTSGVGVGRAYYRTVSAFGIPAFPYIMNVRVTNYSITDGAGGTRDTYIGSMDSASLEGVYFHQKVDGTWECVSKGASNTYTKAITALNATGDFLDIVYSQLGARFYVNGLIVASLAYDAPTASNLTGGAFIITSGAVSGARKFDVDYFGFIISSGGVV